MFTACISMLCVRCSRRNSNGSHNSVGSREWYNCHSIHQYLHNCQEKCLPLLQRRVDRRRGNPHPPIDESGGKGGFRHVRSRTRGGLTHSAGSAAQDACRPQAWRIHSLTLVAQRSAKAGAMGPFQAGSTHPTTRVESGRGPLRWRMARLSFPCGVCSSR